MKKSRKDSRYGYKEIEPGDIYGLKKVIKRIGEKHYNSGLWDQLFLVECTNCGIQSEKTRHYLRNPLKLTSCINCHGEPRGYSGLNTVLCCYRYSAHDRGLEFNLSTEEFRELTSANCTYCGSAPNNINDNNGGCTEWSTYTYNGIDRTDSSKGYYIGNVCTCCILCNRTKMDMSHDKYIAYLNQLVKYRTSPEFIQSI